MFTLHASLHVWVGLFLTWKPWETWDEALRNQRFRETSKYLSCRFGKLGTSHVLHGPNFPWKPNRPCQWTNIPSLPHTSLQNESSKKPTIEDTGWDVTLQQVEKKEGTTSGLLLIDTIRTTSGRHDPVEQECQQGKSKLVSFRYS